MSDACVSTVLPLSLVMCGGSSLAVAPSIPPSVSYTKRAQANSVEGEKKEDWDAARKLPTSGSKGEVLASPLVAQEHRRSTTTASGVGARSRGWRMTSSV